MIFTQQWQEEYCYKEAADASQSLQGPHKRELFLRKAVGYVENIQDNQTYYENADVEKYQVSCNIQFRKPIIDLEKVQKNLDVVQHAVRFPWKLRL